MAYDPRNVDIAALALGPRRAAPPSLRALRGVAPTSMPYSDAERGYAAEQQASALADRQRIWEAQQQGPATFGPASRSPIEESRVAKLANPGWAAFGDAMAQSEYLPQGRGMRGAVDLVGAGPGSGSGIGRWRGQLGRQHGNSVTGSGPDFDLESLMGDAGLMGGASTLAPSRQAESLRALQLLTRGRV